MLAEAVAVVSIPRIIRNKDGRDQIWAALKNIKAWADVITK